jgi:hypothetical protein
VWKTKQKQTKQMQSPEELNRLVNTPLDDVPTSVPVLRACVTTLKVSDAKFEPNQANDGMLLNVIYSTTEPLTSTDGNVIQPGELGSKIFDRISMKITEKCTPQMVQSSLARWKEGVTGSKAGVFGDPQQYIGMVFKARIRPDIDKSGVYADKTVVAGFVK